MKKVIYALALFAVATAANAIPVTFVKHNQSSGTTVSSLVSNGFSSLNPSSFPAQYGGQPGATTAIFDWDGTTLTSTGTYAVATHISSNPLKAAILGEVITDLGINTATQTGSATAYQCNSGDFLVGLNFNVCGGYSFGPNAIDESSPVWTGTTVNSPFGPFGFLNDSPTPLFPTFVSTQADDIFAGGPRTISAYDFQLMKWDGTTLIIGNGARLPIPSLAGTGEQMCFSTNGGANGCGMFVPVPAAAWLFGSALGLLGWARRRVA